MKIEIIKYEDNNDPESPLVGNVLVEMNEKMRGWFSLVRSKKGLVFCNISSVRILGDYKPAFGWTDDRINKKVCADVLTKVKEDYKIE